jgi:hypothetical protein
MVDISRRHALALLGGAVAMPAGVGRAAPLVSLGYNVVVYGGTRQASSLPVPRPATAPRSRCCSDPARSTA